MDKRILVGSALVFSLLSACGGGGGSGGGVSSTPAPPTNTPPPPPPPPPTTFTNWQAAPSNGTLTISGGTIEAPNTNPDIVLYNPGTPYFGTVGTGNLTLDITYTANVPTGFDVRGGLTAVKFSGSGGRELLKQNQSIIKYISPDLRTTLYVADPTTAGYSYMTYGAWGGITSTGGTRNGFHGGSVTPSGSVPTAGSVTYTGTSVGYYADEGGTRIREFTNSVTLDANFGSRSLLFKTSGIIGTLTYNLGSITFSGPISDGGEFSGWSGTLIGSFYGPGAQEVAGAFFMRNTVDVLCSRGCQYVGAFGAKRP